MMRYTYTFLIALVTYIFISPGCNIINPAEQTPTFIRIDSFQFISDPGKGTSSQDITNVRVNFDGETIGIFDLPAVVPILASKRGVLALTPGIAYSGLQDVQVSYDFFRTDTLTIDPQPGKTINVVPKARYYDSNVFRMFILDFEGRDYPFITIVGPDTHGLDSLDVFEGKYSGKISLNSKENIELLLPYTIVSSAKGFVELNYKSSVPFAVGMQANQGEVVEYFIGVKPRSEWTKIYIALADFIFQYPQKSYQLIIKAMPETDAGGYVSLDNIKILMAN